MGDNDQGWTARAAQARFSRRAALLGGAAVLAGCARDPGPSGGSGPITGAPSGPIATPAPRPQPQPQPQPEPEPQPTPIGGQPPFPLTIDTATRLTASSAAQLASLGVDTVFRYYSHVPPSIRGKHLEPAERDIIFGAGMNIAAVWQHYNNCHLTFSERWGTRDAEKALEQAAAVGQPSGTAIYFGVDGDWPYGPLLDDVVRYFEDVAASFQRSGYQVGVYGGGCALETLRQRGLAQRFWLSGSTGFTGTQAFYNSGRWDLFQNQLDIRVAGSVPIDTNIANPSTGGNFGQFGPRPIPSSAETQRRFGDRRFTRRSTTLRAGPSAGARSLGRLGVRRNVVSLAAAQGGFTPVMTQEGGVSRAGDSVRGWIATADLSGFQALPGGVTSYGICGARRAAPADNVRQNCSAPAVAFRRP